jgi:amidase
MFKEYQDYDAVGLAEIVQKKQVKVSEILEAAIFQIERANPQLNAVVYKMYDLAKQEIANIPPESKLAGVPFLIKDLGIDYVGTPTTSGSNLTRNYIATRDSVIMERYRKAGLLTLGKTNTPEFGIMGITEPYLWGPCRNPWNLNLTSGGSSGGAAAAVASRMVPIASADDGGGSIRIPASACGLFGFKPSRGVQPMGPYRNESWLSLVSGHVVSRSVRDSALVLDLTKGLGLGAPYGPTKELQKFSLATQDSVTGKKVAFSKQSLFGRNTDHECVGALEVTLRACADLGMEVVEDQPEINKDELLFSYYVIIAASVAGEVARHEKMMGVKASLKNVEHATWFLKVAGEKLRASHLEQALFNARQATMVWEKFLIQYDYFSTPTMAYAPSPIGLMNITGIEKFAIQMAEFLPLDVVLSTLKKIGTRGIEKTPNTSMFNMSGHPAMSVPTFWTKGNIPIGVQFVGRMGDDASLFALATKLETYFAWGDKRPSIG